MGGGIAMCFANAGIPVTLIETRRGGARARHGARSEKLRAATARAAVPRKMRRQAHGADQRRQLDLAERRGRRSRDRGGVRGHGDQEAGVRRARRVASPARSSRPTPPTSTSTRSPPTKRPQDVLGMHFFSPANVMKLLRGGARQRTAPEALATAIAVGAQARQECRWWSASATVSSAIACCGARREAERLLLEGALPQRGRRAP